MTVAPRQPKPTAKPHSEFQHGPVAAAVNSAVVTLALTTLGRWMGCPPWVALLAGVVLAACLVWAGMHRQPRPLGAKSLIYRAVAMLTVGGWMWGQLATFPASGISTGKAVTLLIVWPTTVVVGLVAFSTHRVPGLIRAAAPAVMLVFSSVLTATLGGPVLAWLTTTMTVTNRLPGFSESLPWVGYSALTLAMIAAPMGVLGTAFAVRELTVAEEQERAQQAEQARLAQQPGSVSAGRVMNKMVCKITNEYTQVTPPDPALPVRMVPNLRVTDVRPWSNGAGTDYIFDLTNNQRGTTMARLRTITDELVTKMNLPDGCGVEVLTPKDGQGNPMGRGFAALSVCNKNVLREEIPYPPIQQRSIMNMLPVGQTRAGTEIGLYMRETSLFLCGQKGSGKTVTIFDIISGALQMTDTLVFGIDLNGGAAFAPFLSAWHEGTVDRPCIDWVATTLEEAAIMAQVALKMALDRKVFYRPLKALHDVNLMPVGNGGPGQPPPAIMIIIDEGAQVTGLEGGQLTDAGREARKALNDLMDLARDAGVTIVFSGLRATADVSDTKFKAGTAARIGMRVSDDQELAYLFGDYSLSGKEIPYQGSGYIRAGHDDSDVHVFKAYFMKPSLMKELGRAVTPWRPYLDVRGLQVAGQLYANRWRRTAGLLWTDPRPEQVVYGSGPIPTAEQASLVGAPTPTVPGGPPSVGVQYAATTVREVKTLDELMSAMDHLREAESAGAGPAPVVSAAADVPAPSAEGVDDEQVAQDEWNRRFADITSSPELADMITVGDFSRLGSAVPVSPDAEIAAANPNTRQILERLVRLHGPIRAKDLHDLLTRGGDWGPAVTISAVAMHKLLKQPGSPEPVAWLAERGPRDPYDHRDRT